MHDALKLPEILLEIFSHLREDGSSLCSIIRVNKQWFQLGTSIIWRDCSKSESSKEALFFRILGGIPGKRRFLYISKIRALSTSAKENRSPMFSSHPSDMNITTVLLRDYNKMTSLQHFSRFMQTALRELELCLCLINRYLMRRLSERCPQLQKLRIIECLMDGSLSLQEFLERLPAVKSIHFSSSENLLNSDTLSYLARRKNLEDLTLDGSVDDGALAKASARVKDPFPATQSLNVNADSLNLPILMPMVRTVRKLSLFSLHSSVDNTLQHVSKLTELRDLTLCLSYADRNCTREGLMSLTPLSNLERLNISQPKCFIYMGVDMSHESVFSSEEFEEFISCFPRLRYLEIDRPFGSINTRALLSIAKHCTEINSLHRISVAHLSKDLKILSTECGPIMTNLRELGVTCYPPSAQDEEGVRSRRTKRWKHA